MKAFRTSTSGVYHISEDGQYSLCGKHRKWAERYNREYETLPSGVDVCKACQKAHAGIETTSDKQQRRQTTRNNNGQYSLYDTCEVCNERPAEFYSDVYECAVCEECSKHEHDNDEPEPPAESMRKDDFTLRITLTPEPLPEPPHRTWALMLLLARAIIVLRKYYDPELEDALQDTSLQTALSLVKGIMKDKIFEGKEMSAEATGLDRAFGALETVEGLLSELHLHRDFGLKHRLIQCQLDMGAALMNSILGWEKDYVGRDYEYFNDSALFRQYHAKLNEILREVNG